ncbi:MAG: glycosyltransferase family 4 protein [Acidobacteriota bacterium]
MNDPSRADRRPPVLVVGPIPPPFGGMARFVEQLLASDLCRDFDLRHFDTSFSAAVRSQSANPGDERYRGKQGLARRYGYVLAGGSWSAVKTMCAGLGSVAAFVRRLFTERPGLVHVFANMHWGFWRAGVFVTLARLTGRQVVFHPLGAIEKFHAASGWIGRRLISFCLDEADIVVLQSPGLARQVSVFTRRPTRGVFNGIDLSPFAGLPRRDPYRADGGVRFVSVGDLGHNKGTWDILAAAGRAGTRLDAASWTFIGRGDLAALDTRARQAGVEDQVRFLGPVDDETKMTAYAEADLFLLPSHAEGQPLSILEAMAAGLPIISTPVGSIAEVVGEDNGILVPPGDVDRLCEAMLRLAGDPAMRARMSASNRAAAAERFDARRLWREIGEIWEQLAASRTS